MNNIKKILKKELKETFRDKKSLAMMLVIPLFIPLVIIGMSALFNDQENKMETKYNRIGFNYELTQEEQEIIKELKLESTTDTDKNLKKLYESKKIDIYITRDENEYTINGEQGDESSIAISNATKYLESYKSLLQSKFLINNNIDVNKYNSIITIKENLEEKENFYGNFVMNYAFLFIIMAITISSTYPSTDSTAGEKERGTLETLLTFPLKSKDIILGKYLSVTISSIVTGVLSLSLAAISLKIANGMFNIYKGTTITFNLTAFLVAILIIVAYSFLISGLAIAIASRCKTFKEAQSSLTPLTFISFFPGMIAFMLKIESSTILSFIPFINYTMIFSDVINGKVNILNIALMIISTIIVITFVIALNIKQYKSEKVLFSE